jgi:hypothetical protein
MTAAPTPPNPGELINKFISQLPDKIKLWRFVGKMAVEQVNKRLVDQVDNYSTREPSNPPVMPKSDKLVATNSNDAPTNKDATVANTQKKSVANSKAKAKASPATTSAKLPIANYDDLSALQILDLLGALNKTELAKIKKYETANRCRQTILKKIAML